jgi:large subunit ribosomal protein L19
MVHIAVKTSPVDMQERKDLPMRAGDTVRVWVKIEEKGKTRLQAFEGTVLGRKGGGTAGATFTVRRVSDGYGVEKIFPLFSPAIDKIEILRHVKTRRAKLYHIREKAAREIRRQMRRMQFVNISTGRKKQEAEMVAEPEAVTETPATETKE